MGWSPLTAKPQKWPDGPGGQWDKVHGIVLYN